MNIVPIAAFNDNYIWLLHNERHAVVVDPGEASHVEAFLAQTGLSLIAVLITHHHADHTGGVMALCQRYGVPVYGPARESIKGVDRPVCDGQEVHFAELELSLTVLDIPGHTVGHVAYYGNGLLFCGDTLFSAGCGRVFEGTAEQMASSLARLAALPVETDVYCAHEYTLSNLAFARVVEPDNAVRDAYWRKCETLRTQKLPTLPTTIGRERAINPFLRTKEAEIIASVTHYTGRYPSDAVACFVALREWKNHF